MVSNTTFSNPVKKTSLIYQQKSFRKVSQAKRNIIVIQDVNGKALMKNQKLWFLDVEMMMMERKNQQNSIRVKEKMVKKMKKKNNMKKMKKIIKNKKLIIINNFVKKANSLLFGIEIKIVSKKLKYIRYNFPFVLKNLIETYLAIKNWQVKT